MRTQNFEFTTESGKLIRITPHAMECEMEDGCSPNEAMLAFVASKVDSGEIPVSGKPVSFMFEDRIREIGEPDGMSAIMDWVRYVTYNYEVFVRRLPGTREVYLLTTFALRHGSRGQWHYEENDGYEGWEQDQIANCARQEGCNA